MGNITKISAFSFGGGDDKYVKFPGENLFQTKGSVSLWFKSDDTRTYQTLLSWGDDKGDNTSRFILYYDSGKYRLGFELWVGNGIFVSSSSAELGVWNHALFSWDFGNLSTVSPFSDYFSIFLNGEEMSTSGSPSLTVPAGNSYIGRSVLSGEHESSSDFVGSMCDVAVWEQKLNEYDACNLFNGGKPSNLRDFYKYNYLRHWWRLMDGRAFGAKLGKVIKDERGTLDGEFHHNGTRWGFDDKVYDVPPGIYISGEQLLGCRSRKNNGFVGVTIPEEDEDNLWVTRSKEADVLQSWSETVYAPFFDGGADKEGRASCDASEGSAFDTESISIGCEVFPNTMPTLSTVLHKSASAVPASDWEIEILLNDLGYVTVNVLSSSYVVKAITSSVDWISANEVARLVFRYDKVAGTAYLDCRNFSRGTTYTYTDAASLPAGRASGEEAVIILGTRYQHSTASSFDGKISEMFWAGESISDDQVSAYFDETPPDEMRLSGLVSYWPMNEGSGGVLYDQTANNFHMSLEDLSSSPWVDKGGLWKVGYDGSAVTYTMATEVNTQEFTVGFRAKIDATTTATLCHRGDTSYRSGYEWFMYNDDESIYLSVSGGATTVDPASSVTYGSAIEVNIAFTFSEGSATLYVWDDGLSAIGIAEGSLGTRQILSGSAIVFGGHQSALGTFVGGLAGSMWDKFYDDRAWRKEEIEDFLYGSSPEAHNPRYFWGCEEGRGTPFSGKGSGTDLVMDGAIWEDR
jgi:hypothetical protein